MIFCLGVVKNVLEFNVISRSNKSHAEGGRKSRLGHGRRSSEDGYSGGGSRDGDGGEGGGDANDHGSHKGGHGSGLDIGSVNMTKFTLSPGKAGSSNAGWGGGGGGIIVNGEKPSETTYQGEGFGGGLGYNYGALPGCVLIEVYVV